MSDDFRRRAERAAVVARILIDAALANRDIQELIVDPALPYSEESIRQSPVVRIDYEEAYAIGGVGECLRATRSKHWGDEPYVLPLSPDDQVDPWRILYVYKPASRYNRRFEQRRRLKELLGRRHRSLVETAKWQTQRLFLERLTSDQATAIRRRLGLSPIEFWRAARGKAFVDLPPREVQLELDFDP